MRALIREIVVTGLAMVGATGCWLVDENRITDGEVCVADDDCETGVCTHGSLCSHSRCECPSGNCAAGGEQTSDCKDGWVCVGYDSFFDPLKEFFGGKANKSDGYCQPTCAAGCPDHYVCDGELCSADVDWAYPEATIIWTGGATGEISGRSQSTTVRVEEGAVITLTGSGSSPSGATIISETWTTVTGSGESMILEGEPIETTVPEGTYRLVSLEVADDRFRGGEVTVIFQSCFGAGKTCGYQGSGCCEACDAATNTCV